MGINSNTIQSLPPEDCTGCAACANRCHVNAITMQPDREGFLHPAIDQKICTGCSACVSVCPVLSPKKQLDNNKTPACYAAWSKDPEIRFQSTSGGVFTHLAQAVLAQKGVVAGARYRPDHLVEHSLIDCMEQIESLRQSKYVQSEIGLIYREIETKLRENTPVLFVGTPCQCAGLRSYLGKGYDNLYLCDFICRGVNSPSVYLAYLLELEENYQSKIKQVWFKNKTFGWNRFCTKIIFEDGQEYLADRETDPFMLGYIKSRLSYYMRPSCYKCRFKGVQRPVDITLGDFWGVEKQFPEIDTKNGVSFLLLQNKNGHRLLSLIQGNVFLKEASLEEAKQDNACIELSAKMGGH